MDYSVFHQLGVALALSSLIGLERERRYQTEGYSGFGGIRTFALIGLVGVMAYMFSGYYLPLFAVITAGFLAFLVAAYVLTTKDKKYAGGTSEIAAILVYLIGVLSAMEMYLLATVMALAVLLILHFKDPLHRWAKHLQNKELISTIEFIIVAFVILPLLPNQGYGPYDFFNPYIVWLMVVFISGISFASYIAIKIFGAKRGVCLTGFLAGFISSTALAFSFSAQSKRNMRVVSPFVLAILIAGSGLFFRVLLEVFVLNRELFYILMLPLLVMGVGGVVISLLLWFQKEEVPKSLERDVRQLKSPFSLVPALKFAVFFALILFVSKFAMDKMGDRGIYLTSGIAGLLDVDAITLSVANLSRNGLSVATAGVAITIAVVVNTFSKVGIFLIFGNRKVALKLLGGFSVVVALGLLSLGLV